MAFAMAMFPLSTVLFPGGVLPLHVFEPRYRIMLEDCLKGDRGFGVVLISRGSEVGGGDVRVSVGTAATIEDIRSLPDGRSLLLARGGKRFRVEEWLPDDPYPKAMLEWMDDDAGGADLGRLVQSACAAVTRARSLLAELQEVPRLLTEAPTDPTEMSWWLCDQAPIGSLDRQRLLECDRLGRRFEMLASLAEAAGDDLARMLSSG